jgi:metal-dependent amidase/aminoacylase/carboxypeptidase family protein
MKQIVEGTAATFGATAVDYKRNYPVMVNHRGKTRIRRRGRAQGVRRLRHQAPLVMGGEDFAFMLEERPGAYILVGNGDTAPVHHPKYNFNDEAIPAGCSWWAEIVEQRLPAGRGWRG